MNRNEYISDHGQLSKGIMLNVAEILTLRLPEGTERITASKWVKKFLVCDSNDYKHNLSLFICSLTKQILVEPFNLPPQDMSHAWQGFAREYTTKDINTAVHQRMFRDSFTPAYQIEISQNLQEYVAFQEIPLFGAHFYYAFSPNMKINHWQNFNTFKIPRYYVEALQKLQAIETLEEESPIRGKFSKIKARPKESSTRVSKIVKPAAKPQKVRPGFDLGKVDEADEEEKPPELELQPKYEAQIQALLDNPHIPEGLRSRLIQKQKTQNEKEKAKKEKDEQELQKIGTKPTKAATKRQPKGATGPKPTSSATSAASTSKPLKDRRSLRRPGTRRGPPEPVAPVEYQKPYIPVLEEVESSEEEIPIDEMEAKLDKFRKLIKQRQTSSKLHKIPEKLLITSAALTNEMKRAQDEQSADATMVNAIHDAQIDIGRELMNEGTKQYRVQQEIALAKDFEDLQVKIPELKLDTSQDILDKLAEMERELEEHARREAIKAEEARLEQEAIDHQVALELRAIEEAKNLIGPHGIKNSILDYGQVDLISIYNPKDPVMTKQVSETIVEAQKKADKLFEITPTDEIEESIVNEIIENNLQVAHEAEEELLVLIKSIENNDPDLDNVVLNAANNLEQIINSSNERDRAILGNAEASNAVLAAAQIQDERNVVLDGVLNQTAQIVRNIQHKNAGKNNYKPQDLKVRQHLGYDDEILDMDELNVDLEEDSDEVESFMNKTRKAREDEKAKQQDRNLTVFQIAAEEAEEDLENIEFVEILDKSLDTLSELEDELQEALENAESGQEREKLEDVLNDTQTKMQEVKEIKKIVQAELAMKLKEMKTAGRFNTST